MIEKLTLSKAIAQAKRYVCGDPQHAVYMVHLHTDLPAEFQELAYQMAHNYCTAGEVMTLFESIEARMAIERHILAMQDAETESLENLQAAADIWDRLQDENSDSSS